MGTTSYWQRFERQRISRRRLLGTAGAGAAGLFIVTACGSDKKGPAGGKTPGQTPSGTPRAGGTYKTAITGDWGTLDPLTSVAFGPGIIAKMYNGLAIRSTLQPDQFFLDLAESYEQPEDDATTYIFTMRPGVKIAPNSLGIAERDMDAEDCKAWLDATVAAPTAVAKRWTNTWLDSSEATDAQHFQVKTKGPYAYFFYTINVPVGGMIPPKEMLGLDIKTTGAGGGAYVLRDGTFVETGGAILDRNPNYYRKDENNNNAALPYIDTLEISRISDRQPRRTAFIDGQIDSYDPETRAEVTELQNQVSGISLFEEPAFTFISFTMNPTKDPWKDERVRMAANYALNRQQYVDIVFGGDAKPDGLVHWSLGDFALTPDELEELQPFDPEKSKQLIQDAGHELPLKIKVMYPADSDIESHNKHLPIWLEQMRAAGFEIEEERLDFTTWLTRYQAVDYDASLSLNQIYETPEINLDFHGSKGPTNDGNYAIGIGSLYPEIEQAIKDSKSTTDAEEHVRRVHETQKLIYSKGPAFLPLVTWTDFTVRQGAVKNFPTGLGTAYELYLNTAWLDR